MECTCRASMSFAFPQQCGIHSSTTDSTSIRGGHQRKVDFHHNHDALGFNHEFDDQHHQHDNVSQAHPQHQVEGLLHYHHHPHQGHHIGDLCHQFCHHFSHCSKRITSGFPGELVGGRGVRQPLSSQYSALSRSLL